MSKQQSKTQRQEQDQQQQADPTGVADHPRTKSGKLSPNGLPCLCGCGGQTTRTVAKFISGHDAKLKGRMVRMVEERPLPDDGPIPKIAIPFLCEEGISGFGMSWDEIDGELKLFRTDRR